MQPYLKNYLQALKAYGLQNSIPNITPEVGQFLNMMIKIQKPKTILEIGCANGYSTIWMAEAADQVGATIHTVDFSAPTFAEAQKNIKEVQLDDCIKWYFGSAQKILPQMPANLHFDFVFVDGQKAAYLEFWELIQPKLNSGAVVIFDDMLAFQEKTKPFTESLKHLRHFDQLLLPIDGEDGILLLRKP